MKAQFGIDEALADSSKSEAEEYMANHRKRKLLSKKIARVDLSRDNNVGQGLITIDNSDRGSISF